MPFDRVPERGEVLTRFIFSRGHFSPAHHRVKADAFLPDRDTRETSVFRAMGLSLADVRGMGATVGEGSGRGLKAWGDVLAGAVFDVGLDVRPDNIPARHASIVGWPGAKDQQISLAQQLAAAATLHLPQ